MTRNIYGLLLSLSLVAGCSFKPTQEIDDARVRVALDWGAGTDPAPSRAIKASRSLVRSSESGFEARDSVTLPVTAPDWLELTLSVPRGAISNDPAFAKAKVVFEGKQFELPARLTHSRSTDAIFEAGVVLGGMQALLSPSFSVRARLQVDFYESEKRVLSLGLPLRTPPSQLDSASEGVRKTRASTRGAESGLVSSVVSGVQFNLIRTVRFTNQEDSPVEVRIPRQIIGSFEQVATSVRLEDTGCGDRPGILPGFARSSWPMIEAQTSSLYLIPMDDQWVVEADGFVSSPTRSSPTVRRLAPGESLAIGVYATGGGSDGWAERMARGSELTDVTGPGECKWECSEHSRPCGPRGQFCMSGCLEWWMKGRGSVTLPVGIERTTPPVLRFPNGGPVLQFRFGDFDANQDPEVRQARLFSEEVRVEP